MALLPRWAADTEQAQAMRRAWRIVWLSGLVLAAIVVARYAAGRALHGWQPVRMEELFGTRDFELPRYPGQGIRVAAWNIAHGRGGGTDAPNRGFATRAELLAHLNEVAKQIRDSRADVVVLNEVDFDANWSFGVNQATWLAEKAGYGYVVEQANMDVWVPFGRWRFGNAVLSRIPVVRWESVRFPPRSRWEAWLVGNHDGLLVELQNEEVGLNVFAVHLDFRDEATRVRAAERIAEVAGRSFWPFVAAGDFNSSPKGHRAAELDAGGANAVTFLIEQQGFVPASPLAEDAALYTFPSARLTRTIDWILAQDAGQLDFGGTIPSALSDHLMIWADVAPPAAESR